MATALCNGECQVWLVLRQAAQAAHWGVKNWPLGFWCRDHSRGYLIDREGPTPQSPHQFLPCRVAQKSRSQTFVHIVAKYWPIFKIFSLAYSVENL